MNRSRVTEILGTPLAHSIGAEHTLVWAAFAGLVLPLGVIMALTMSGNGILMLGPATFNAHIGYTLTLPVSRVHIIWTRMVAGFGAAIVATVLGLAFACALVVARGRGVPLVPVALSAAFSIPFMMACTTVLEALRFLNQGVALLGGLALISLVGLRGLDVVMAFPARGEMPWLAMAGLLAITGLGFFGTVLLSRRREF
jgi:ABC-type spermidine/putrescine transport system permease subunit II